MSDRVPGGVWQPANDDTPPARRHVQREQVFQLIVTQYLDRVVQPPYFYTAICHENELTDNARARARARGVRPGVPDLYLCQGGEPPRSVWLELKWAGNRPSDAQRHVADQLRGCGIPHAFVWTVLDVLVALHHSGIRLHANARNLADEFQSRAEAGVVRAELRAPARTTTTKKLRRTGKPTLRMLQLAAKRVGL